MYIDAQYELTGRSCGLIESGMGPCSIKHMGDTQPDYLFFKLLTLRNGITLLSGISLSWRSKITLRSPYCSFTCINICSTSPPRTSPNADLITLSKGRIPPPHLNILPFSYCVPNTLQQFSVAPYLQVQ